MENLLRFKFRDGKKEIFPINNLVKNWLFTEDEKEEAMLAQTLAEVAQKNGITNNEISHIFPCVLRMLKSNICWSK